MKLFATATVALFALLAIGNAVAADEHTDDEGTTATAEGAPVTEPPIKLVHVLQPGEREYLSPNLIGVQNIAMTFLPLSMNFINIIDAYREIVNGVSYEILLNAVDTKAKDPKEADIICRLVILEKPWLRTQWGDKYRELVNSNCTADSTENRTIDDDDRSKVLNEKYVSNSIFNRGQRNELSDQEMARLEAQILTGIGSVSNSKRKVSKVNSGSRSEATNEATTISSTTAISIDDKEEVTTVVAPLKEESDTTTEELDVDATATTPAAELNDNEKRWLDGFLSVGAYNFEKSLEEQRAVDKKEEGQVAT